MGGIKSVWKWLERAPKKSWKWLKKHRGELRDVLRGAMKVAAFTAIPGLGPVWEGLSDDTQAFLKSYQKAAEKYGPRLLAATDYIETDLDGEEFLAELTITDPEIARDVFGFKIDPDLLIAGGIAIALVALIVVVDQ